MRSRVEEGLPGTTVRGRALGPPPGEAQILASCAAGAWSRRCTGGRIGRVPVCQAPCLCTCCLLPPPQKLTPLSLPAQRSPPRCAFPALTPRRLLFPLGSEALCSCWGRVVWVFFFAFCVFFVFFFPVFFCFDIISSLPGKITKFFSPPLSDGFTFLFLLRYNRHTTLHSSVQRNDSTFVYIMITTHSYTFLFLFFSHFFFLVTRAFKTYSHSNFHICNMGLLAVVTTLYLTSSGATIV